LGYSIPTINGFPAYAVVSTGYGPNVTTTVEFGLATPQPTTVGLTVTSNFNDAGAPLVLQSDGCSNNDTDGLGADNGIQNAFPSPAPTTTMPPNNAYPFTFQAASTMGAGTCSLQIVDTANSLTASLNLSFDNSTLVVQGKGRK
jgi:hypothetical protein